MHPFYRLVLQGIAAIRNQILREIIRLYNGLGHKRMKILEACPIFAAHDHHTYSLRTKVIFL
jgi:hypothetical protein